MDSSIVDKSIVDKQAALARLDGDKELYAEVVALYKEDAPVQLENLKRAHSQKSLTELERLAHSLKSASANIGAIKMTQAALDLEKAARAKEEEKFPGLILAVENSFAELLRVLQ